MPIYYIYAYLNNNGTPYYIGKGKSDRAWKKHRNIHTPTDRNKIIIMESNLTEIGALALETRYQQGDRLPYDQQIQSVVGITGPCTFQGESATSTQNCKVSSV